MITKSEKNLSLELISDPFDIRYLTGLSGLSALEHEFYLVKSTSKIYILTSILYEQQALLLCKKNQIYKYLRITQTNKLAYILKKLCLHHHTKLIIFNPDSLSFREYDQIRRIVPHPIKIQPSESRFRIKRQIKSEQEIKYLQKAAANTDACLQKIIGLIKPGITEEYLKSSIYKIIYEIGSSPAFDPVVAFGPYTSEPHYISSDTRLKKNTLILVDFGATSNGYTSDMTRMLYFGKPPDEIVNAYRIVLEAKNHAVEYLRLRNKPQGNIADRIAKDLIKAAGFPPYKHSLGHNLGLEIHENPRLTIKKKNIVKPGMVFTVEPAIYLPGKFGIRLEDTYVKTEDSLIQLTKSPIKLITVSAS